MTQKLTFLLVAAFLVLAPQHAQAATFEAPIESKVVEFAKSIVLPTKKIITFTMPLNLVSPKEYSKSVACNNCKALSLAEGADVSTAKNAAAWQGTVIGVNEGSRSLVITESNKLNRINAFAQRAVQVIDATVIVQGDDESIPFSSIDIGYRISVRGEYDPNQRVVSAHTIRILEIPNEPVTKTK